MDPQGIGCSREIGDGGVTELSAVSLDIAHGEVNGKDDGQTDHSDDEDKDNQVSLEPENLDDDSNLWELILLT